MKIYEVHQNDPQDPEDIIEEIIHLGRPNPTAFNMSVPNDSLAILIGKNADTLKMLKNMSGVERIAIANMGTAGVTERNLYIFGDIKAYEKSKQMIKEIIEKHK